MKFSTFKVIGLLGGSFNPAHEGHVHISLEAKRALGLHEVWWLVSPQNPLKEASGMAPFEKRFAHAKEIAKSCRFIRVSDIETQMGTRYTIDTLEALKKRFPYTRFVWLMGADNLASIHRWQRFEDIFKLYPILVIDRAPYARSSLNNKAAQRFKSARIPENQLRRLTFTPTPAWGYLHSRLHPLSATYLRKTLGDAAFLRHN